VLKPCNGLTPTGFSYRFGVTQLPFQGFSGHRLRKHSRALALHMYSSINSRNYSVKGDKYTIIKPFTSSYNAILDVIKSDDNNLNKQINSPPPQPLKIY
jgi:hypothetical protein